MPLELRESLERAAREQLASRHAVHAATLPLSSTDLLMGSTAKRIVEHAETTGANLIVMGTHGRGGFGHLLLGSIAEKVVRTAKCPVLTAREPQPSPCRVTVVARPKPNGAAAVDVSDPLPPPCLRIDCLSALRRRRAGLRTSHRGVAGRVLDQTGAPLAGVTMDSTRRRDHPARRQRRSAAPIGSSLSPAGAVEAHLSPAQLHRGASRQASCDGQTQTVDAVLALSLQRRRRRDGRGHVPEHRRHPESRREPGRHRVGRQPGRDHGRAARGQADHAPG